MTKRALPYNRDTALDAAMTLFWAKGFHATSLKDLEGALNMKPGSIYAAFTSKEALYRSALERYFNKGLQDFNSAIESGPTPLTALTGYLREIGQSTDDSAPCGACMLTKTILGEVEIEAAIALDARAYMTRMRAAFTVAFAKAKAMGEIPLDADTDRLSLRYQSNITALKIELQSGTDHAEVVMLAEDMAEGYEQLGELAHA